MRGASEKNAALHRGQKRLSETALSESMHIYGTCLGVLVRRAFRSLYGNLACHVGPGVRG